MAETEFPKHIAEYMYILQPNFLLSKRVKKKKGKILKRWGLLEIDEQTILKHQAGKRNNSEAFYISAKNAFMCDTLGSLL